MEEQIHRRGAEDAEITQSVSAPPLRARRLGGESALKKNAIIASAKEQRKYRSKSLLWLALLAATCLTYFIALGRPPLISPDEPRYAQVAREMWQRGDLITPTLGGYVWFEKPVLPYWLMMASYSAFGVSEFAARLPSACAGVFVVLLLGLIGKEIEDAGETQMREEDGNFTSEDETLAGDDKKSTIEDEKSTDENREQANASRRSPVGHRASFINHRSSFITHHFSLICAAIAAASGGLLAFSRGATFDIILTLTLTITLAAFLIAEISSNRTSESRTRFNFLSAVFYIGIGASLLAKGLVGVVIPCGVIGFYLLLRRKFSRATRAFLRRAWWGAPLSLLVAATWYAPVIARHGWRFVDEFFIQQHFARYVSNKYHHPQPFWYYVPVMLGLSLPFTFFLLESLWRARHWNWRGESLVSRVEVFAFAWLLFPVLFFSASGSKLPGYVLPALPGAILLSAIAVSRYLNADDKTKSHLATMRLTGALVLILGIGGCLYAVRELHLALEVSFAFIILPTFIAGICALIIPKKRALCFALLVAASLSIVAGVARTGLESASERESVRALLRVATARGFADAPVYEMHMIERSAEFYAAGRLAYRNDGEPVKLEGPTEVEAIARRLAPQPVLVLIPIEYVYQLQNDSSLQTEIIGDNGTLALVAVKMR